jgi:hypothetical protein
MMLKYSLHTIHGRKASMMNKLAMINSCEIILEKYFFCEIQVGTILLCTSYSIKYCSQLFFQLCYWHFGTFVNDKEKSFKTSTTEQLHQRRIHLSQSQSVFRFEFQDFVRYASPSGWPGNNAITPFLLRH